MKCNGHRRWRMWLSGQIALAGLALVLFAPVSVTAQTFGLTAQEAAMLPEYCKYTQSFRSLVEGGNNPEKIRQWSAILGGIFNHMHHYCDGLVDVNFAKLFARTEAERRPRLSTSLTQFDYVIQRSEPTEKMLPEFYTKKGESLIALGNGPLAIVELNRAIELKPDYWPPYAAQSDYYKKTGNIKLAREILQQGLEASPDAKALTRRLSELDTVKDNSRSASGAQKKAADPK